MSGWRKPILNPGPTISARAALVDARVLRRGASWTREVDDHVPGGRRPASTFSKAPRRLEKAPPNSLRRHSGTLPHRRRLRDDDRRAKCPIYFMPDGRLPRTCSQRTFETTMRPVDRDRARSQRPLSVRRTASGLHRSPTGCTRRLRKHPSFQDSDGVGWSGERFWRAF